MTDPEPKPGGDEVLIEGDGQNAPEPSEMPAMPSSAFFVIDLEAAQATVEYVSHAAVYTQGSAKQQGWLSALHRRVC